MSDAREVRVTQAQISAIWGAIDEDRSRLAALEERVVVELRQAKRVINSLTERLEQIENEPRDVINLLDDPKPDSEADDFRVTSELRPQRSPYRCGGTGLVTKSRKHQLTEARKLLGESDRLLRIATEDKLVEALNDDRCYWLADAGNWMRAYRRDFLKGGEADGLAEQDNGLDLPLADVDEPRSECTGCVIHVPTWDHRFKVRADCPLHKDFDHGTTPGPEE
jgi:hypothetical protein